jgi:predicted O-methyltransferase YrrM
MLNILFKKLQKLVNWFGFNLLISRIKVDSDINFAQQVRLSQKNINNLKVVLNRELLLKKLPKEGIIAELGVDKGDFSDKIISLTQPKKLYLIDIWDSERYNRDKMVYVKRRFQKEIDTGKVIIIKGTSENELLKFKNGHFDWIYIDTAHTYEQTVRELDLCRQKVKDGGIIAGHDYCQGDIKNAQAYGVVQAVNQFCIKYDWEFIYITHETDRTLSFAIKKLG